jgi:hypothetical protein
MGGRQCSVCAHPQTAAITKEIAARVSFREIASHFDGITFPSVGRHAQKCLRLRRSEKPAASEARSTAAVSSRLDPHDQQTLISTTAKLVDEALDLLEHAKKADDRRTALVALREARDGLALLMKVAGLLQPDGGVVIDARRQTLIANVAELSVAELRSLAAGQLTGDTINAEARPC